MARTTRATTALAATGRRFEVLAYDYDPEAPSIGLHAAQALGLPPAVVFKTLMTRVGEAPCVALVPSDAELNLKGLAAAAGAKSAVMMPVLEAERLSGYVVGGISPFGQKKRLPCFVDGSALALPFMVVNGGQRGLQIKLAPADLVAALSATLADLASRA